MWSRPVTFGGWITMQNGSPSGCTSGAKAPACSLTGYQRSSKDDGS